MKDTATHNTKTGGSFYSRDIILILTASFFYFSSPMLTTPLITGFTGSLGADAVLTVPLVPIVFLLSGNTAGKAGD